MLLERLSEKFPQFRIDSLRVIVAQEAKAGVDFLFQHFAVNPGEGSQHLDQGRKQVGGFGNGLRLASDASPSFFEGVLQTRSSTKDTVEREDGPPSLHGGRSDWWRRQGNAGFFFGGWEAGLHLGEG